VGGTDAKEGQEGMKKFIAEIRMTVSKVILIPADDEDGATGIIEDLLEMTKDRDLLGITEVTATRMDKTYLLKTGGEEFSVVDGTVDIHEVRTVKGTGYDG
jgi:hypothetical protein